MKKSESSSLWALVILLGVVSVAALNANDETQEDRIDYRNKQSIQTRNNSENALKGRYSEQDAKLDRLVERVNRASGSEKKNLQIRLDNLRFERAVVGKQIEEFSRGAEKNWKASSSRIEVRINKIDDKLDAAIN